MAVFNYSGSLAASGSTVGERISQPFNIAISGTWVGTWALEALPNGATAWVNCLQSDGSQNSYSSNGLITVPNVFGDDMLFRLTFTRTSGTLEWRFFR